MKRAITVLMITSCLAPGCQRQGESYAPVPQSILTPDVVETRLGKLEFFDGYPSVETVEKVYDHLDFMRGVRAFLDTIPVASLYAMREGFRDVGCVDGPTATGSSGAASSSMAIPDPP